MSLDYKIRSVVKDDAGNVVSSIVDIYEGDVTTELEPVDGGFELEKVTRYRRSKQVETATVKPVMAPASLVDRLNAALVDKAAALQTTTIAEQATVQDLPAEVSKDVKVATVDPIVEPVSEIDPDAQ